MKKCPWWTFREVLGSRSNPESSARERPHLDSEPQKRDHIDPFATLDPHCRPFRESD